MKFFISLLAIFAAIAAATPTPDALVVHSLQKRTCADPSTSTGLYMAYNDETHDRIYTVYYDEFFFYFRHYGYPYFEFSANVWLTEQEGTVPLWLVTGDSYPHRYYTGSVEEKDNLLNNLGYTWADIVAWIYGTPDPSCGSLPLFHLVDNTYGDHYYTTSTTNRDLHINSEGFTYVGITGYVLPFTE